LERSGAVLVAQVAVFVGVNFFIPVVVAPVAAVTGRLAGSSGEVRLRIAAVVVVTEGLVERYTDYLDIDEARAAAERLAGERADA
jgi:hypothetical protein